MKQQLEQIYGAMKAHFGTTHWWPGESPFEVAVGAILTQNTAWTNVERAIANLKNNKLLSPSSLLSAPREAVEVAIRSSGYYRQKTLRLTLFCQYLMARHKGSMKRMAGQPLKELRGELLAIKGIGPETADDILLYACDKPIFVVDAYTRRILHRCGLVTETIDYHALQSLFHRHLVEDVALFKEYHGLLVFTGKDFCRKLPQCAGCPLARSANVQYAYPCHRLP